MITYQRAKDAVFPNRAKRKRSFTPDTAQLRNALRSLEVPVADQCIRVTKGTSQLTQTALLKINRQPGGAFHWVFGTPAAGASSTPESRPASGL